MTRLPPAPWQKESGLVAVVAALRGAQGDGQCRFVGGAVRDTLLGLPVGDVDLATPLRPDAIIRRLNKANLKAVPTGIEHGTVTAVADGRGYEITTLRRDVSTDGRRATVEFSGRWEEDAARRDFTINALYADPETGLISDYFGGLEDLARRHIRFIGDANARIAEDYLRILRYFRFLARFGEHHVDGTAMAACRNAAHSLKTLSRERIASELMQLLTAADPGFVVGRMQEGLIFDAFMPEVTANAESGLQQLISREQIHGFAPEPHRRLAALLPVDAPLAENISARLKFSRRSRQILSQLMEISITRTTDIRALAYAYGVDLVRDAILLRAGDDHITAALETLHNWEIPVFPLKGGALVERGVGAGPDVARLLQKIEKIWIAEGFPSTERVGQLADQAAADFGKEQK